MSKLETSSYKGVRDFYPEDMAVQNYIFGIWRKVAEDFGYVEYSASILEPAELYKSKTSEEIVTEQTFSFVDRGGREVVLRPEMTPTLARMVAARRRTLKFPLRWYSIPNVFRYERPQRGRRREHWQLNCDLMGIGGVEAEVEIITLAYKIMKEFGAKDEDFSIRISSRKALPAGTDMEQVRKIDRGEDIGVEITETEEIRNLLTELGKTGIKNVVFDPKIVRGFDYYTGIVFEVFDTHEDNRRSLFGGGRYDNLLEVFGVDPIPTVGFGMGDITIRDFLETHKLPTHK
ncbi:ATP phosphoribosyltransferase regulatory subunit [Candidatus Parcubacteria bacterium]|nr:ATP phosphoribosyltransferase regulatory subunit [Candidatus Parcubacteria bacterium]